MNTTKPREVLGELEGIYEWTKEKFELAITTGTDVVPTVFAVCAPQYDHVKNQLGRRVLPMILDELSNGDERISALKEIGDIIGDSDDEVDMFMFFSVIQLPPQSRIKLANNKKIESGKSNKTLALLSSAVDSKGAIRNSLAAIEKTPEGKYLVGKDMDFIDEHGWIPLSKQDEDTRLSPAGIVYTAYINGKQKQNG